MTAQPHPCFVGIDGGGTSTRAALLAVDPDGTASILGIGKSGVGNLHDVGPDLLGRHLREAFERGCEAAGREPASVAGAFCGMASVVRENDRRTVADLVTGAGIANQVEVDHDLRISLHAGLGGQPGIVVIAGTGSSCYGRSASGDSWIAGSWGSFLDDRGSSFELGRRALIACAEAHDRRGPTTALSDTVWERLQLAEWRDLLARVDADGGMSRSEVASLARLVVSAADAGDAVALGLIDDGTAQLARCIETVARETGQPEPLVTATGGLATSGSTWRGSFECAVAARLPAARVIDPVLDPVVGAALLAAQTAGIAVRVDSLAPRG